MVDKVTPGLAARLAAYYRDPRPDLVPALKILRRSKLPALAMARYFLALAANKVPCLAGRFDRPPVDFTRYMQAYDRTTASWHPYREAQARLVDLLDLKGGEVVIDLGSGTGNQSLAIEARGARAVALDSCRESLHLHKQKTAAASLVQADLNGEHLPFANCSADRVCAVNLWTYLSRWERRDNLYQEIRRILKPGGFFVLGVEAEGYSPSKILKYHLGREYRRRRADGRLPLTAAAEVYADFISRYEDLLITASESLKLMRKIAAREYAVFCEQSIRAELAEGGFRPLSLERTYAGQVIMIKAEPF